LGGGGGLFGITTRAPSTSISTFTQRTQLVKRPDSKSGCPVSSLGKIDDLFETDLISSIEFFGGFFNYVSSWKILCFFDRACYVTIFFCQVGGDYPDPVLWSDLFLHCPRISEAPNEGIHPRFEKKKTRVDHTRVSRGLLYSVEHLDVRFTRNAQCLHCLS